MTTRRSDVAQLHDFQRSTVDYVVKRMYDDPDETRRFLVADEVGLGKTLVARAVIAEAIERLWDTPERIDIVYVCSNAQIARQNLRRLNVLGLPEHDLPDRITMLPRALKQFSRHKVNLVAFTPGTSFQMGNSQGKYTERAMLYRLVQEALPHLSLGRRRTAYELFQRNARAGFGASLDRTRIGDLDEAVRRAFSGELRADSELCDELAALVAATERRRMGESEWSRRGLRALGRLRDLLARACVDALEPDLVIMDEFQRFPELLDNRTHAGELAHALLGWGNCRSLLLSATPYRMLTLSDERLDEDHYADFLRTCEFLFEGDHGGQGQIDRLTNGLARLRSGLLDGAPLGELRSTRDEVRGLLSRVMARTERLAAEPNRAGMLKECRQDDLAPRTEDVRTFVAMDRVSRLVEAQGVTPYWKSAPYLLTFMDGYQLRQRFDRKADDHGQELARTLRRTAATLPRRRVERYQSVDPGHPAMRHLVAELERERSFELLWVPPTLPYFRLRGAYGHAHQAFTKRLVFSAWHVVPRAVASLLSYEAERRTVGREHERSQHAQVGGRLEFTTRGGEPANIPHVALLLPSPSLARLGDPLRQSAAHGRRLPVDRGDLLKEVQADIERRLEPHLREAPGAGSLDRRWYAVAPLLLDGNLKAVQALETGQVADGGEEPGSSFRLHRAAVEELVNDPGKLRRPPQDLGRVLAQLAVSGPGTSSLRALARASGGDPACDEPEVLNAAARVAWTLRGLFNQPEVTAIVDRSRGRDYWRKVLQHSLDGCLPSVLDEYAHLLVESGAQTDDSLAERASKTAALAVESINIRTAPVVASDIAVEGNQVRTRHRALRLRCRFAMRFGQERDEEKAVQRAVNVRGAFNSPFWPFVLVSTSLGQEGLDFHPYCHTVVHWNLPRNPVDLEQREGRVHRYKGHAVRKNVATHHGSDPQLSCASDAWQALFDLAARDRAPADSDLKPYWVYPGPAQIQRVVPLLPLSSEVQLLDDLHRTLGLYRLAFGQPRQDDLLDLLRERYSEEELQKLVAELRIDLSPPRP